MPATGSASRRKRSKSMERLGKAANAVCKLELHLGPVSLGSRGISRRDGVKVGAEGSGLGTGFETVAVWADGEAGACVEAWVRHHTKWYALQPVDNPPRAFGNLIRQVDDDYRRFIPSALHLDAPGFYERILTTHMEPRIRELGWGDIEAIQRLLEHPAFIYGRVRGQVSIGLEMEVKYGATDDDGFQWYGATVGVPIGLDAKVSGAIGLLPNASGRIELAEAVQLRLGIGHVRISFVLSSRPLALRRGELDDDLRVAAANLVAAVPRPLAAIPRRIASGRGDVRGVVELEQKMTVWATTNKPMNDALESALAGALSGVIGDGCIAVNKLSGDSASRSTSLTFDVFLEDLNDITAVRCALALEAECRGSKLLLPGLINGLDAAGVPVGHIKIVRLDVEDDVPNMVGD